MQLDHYSTHFKSNKFPVHIVCENVNNAPNIGSLFRTADAFGVEKLIFCGENISLGRKMTKTSRATEKSVNFEIKPNAIEVVSELKESGSFIIALEITTTSEALVNYTVPKDKALVLIIGDENFGVSEDLLNLSDAIITVTLYEITKQLQADIN